MRATSSFARRGCLLGGEFGRKGGSSELAISLIELSTTNRVDKDVPHGVSQLLSESDPVAGRPMPSMQSPADSPCGRSIANQGDRLGKYGVSEAMFWLWFPNEGTDDGEAHEFLSGLEVLQDRSEFPDASRGHDRRAIEESLCRIPFPTGGLSCHSNQDSIL